MAAAPWLLSGLGVALVVFGALASGVFGPGTSRTGVDPRMSDAEIGKRLNRRLSLGIPGLVIFAGLICLLFGAGWRLLRMFF